MKCPLCGGKVIYEGLVSIECGGPSTCQNSKAVSEAEEFRLTDAYDLWVEGNTRLQWFLDLGGGRQFWINLEGAPIDVVLPDGTHPTRWRLAP